MDDKLLQEIDELLPELKKLFVLLDSGEFDADDVSAVPLIDDACTTLQQARDRLEKKKDTITMPRSIYKMLTERAELHPDSAKLLYENAEDLYITSPPPAESEE